MRDDDIMTEEPVTNNDQPGQAESAAEGRRGGLYDGFEGYRTPSEADYRDLLTHGIVVPDTNVFLNLYRYTEQTRSDLLSVLRDLGDQLWVPNQVIREFWKNREALLQDPQGVAAATQELANLRNHTISTFRGWATRVGMENQLITEFVSPLDKAFVALMDGISRTTDNNMIEFARDTCKDPILGELELILKGRVGLPLNDTELKTALAEARRRVETKEPPGYSDARKEDPGGDYLIWTETLREAERRKQNVLFVTGDIKGDWWRISRGELQGPRPELIEEMKKLAGVKFFILSPDNFLMHAAQVLRVKVQEDSVQNIERINRIYQDLVDTAMGRAPL
jgi:hypothetical protein